MAGPDLNLLYTLDVLLQEGSVTRAGRRLRLSPSAMSRALARLREVTGDQLLVRAGRGLVPTPRASEMREKVREFVQSAQDLLRPTDGLDLSRLRREFVIRASDGFVESYGPRLIAKVQEEAPSVQLRFIRKLDKSSEALRNGSVHLETGVLAQAMGPEVRARALFIDRYIGAVRAGHPLASGAVTPAEYTSWNHVIAWREGLNLGDVDEQLAQIGLAREITSTVDGFAAALAIARGSDLIATVPEKHTSGLWGEMHTFALPLPVRDFTLSLLWHPRLNGDPAHRWLRNMLWVLCQ